MDAPILENQAPHQILITELDRDIVVQNSRYRLRIPAGTPLVVNLVDDNPRNRTPLRVSHPSWNEFFWIGRQKVIHPQWVVTEMVDGHSRYKYVEPPVAEEENHEETAPAAPVGVLSGGEPAAGSGPGSDASYTDEADDPFYRSAPWSLKS